MTENELKELNERLGLPLSPSEAFKLVKESNSAIAEVLTADKYFKERDHVV